MVMFEKKKKRNKQGSNYKIAYWQRKLQHSDRLQCVLLMFQYLTSTNHFEFEFEMEMKR